MQLRSILALSLVLFTSALFAACSGPAARPVPGPDGTTHQLISCNYIEACYQDAARVCSQSGGKYKIVNTTSEMIGMYRMRDFQIMLLVKCEDNIPSASPSSTPSTIPAPATSVHLQGS